MTIQHPPFGPVVFKASAKSQLRSTRMALWLSALLSVAIVAWLGNIPLQSLAYSAIFLLTFFGFADWMQRRQLKPGRALVTLHEDGIESASFPGKLRWNDITRVSIEMVGGTPQLRLELNAALGHKDQRNFWTGNNDGKPTILLTPFSPADQEALFNAVQQHLQRVVPHATAHNPMAAERAFQDGLKALAPHTWITYGLIALNVAAWAMTLMSGADAFKPTAAQMLQWGGNTAFDVQQGQWWRLLSATFLHNGVVHLAMNMLGLWVIGQTVERIYGHRLFLLLYLAAALSASAWSLHFAARQHVSVGASGAVFGIAGALLVAVLQHRKTLPKLFGKQTLSGIGFFVVYSLAQGFATPGVDNAAHVGGLLVGAGLALILPERFDMTRFATMVRSRTALASLLAAALTVGAIASAPPATVDLQRVFAGEAAFQHAMQHMQAAMQSLKQDAQRKDKGQLSALELDDRSRTVHAPAFDALQRELAKVWLRPDDPRAALLLEVQRFTSLVTESLAMASVVPHAGADPQPADPQRMRVLEQELKKASERMAALGAQLAARPKP